MKALLALGADFIDRLCNPVHGVNENEAYAVRFAELISRDEDLRRLLDADDLGADDVDLLPTIGWLWYLRWRRDTASDIPSSGFLDGLYDSVGDPVVHLGVLDAVCCHPVVVQKYSEVNQERVVLHSLPSFWVRDRLVRLVSGEETKEYASEHEAAAWAEAVEFVTLLLQVGNEVALTTVRALIASPSLYREKLVSLVEDILRASARDEQAVLRWRRDLGLEHV